MELYANYYEKASQASHNKLNLMYNFVYDAKINVEISK